MQNIISDPGFEYDGNNFYLTGNNLIRDVIKKVQQFQLSTNGSAIGPTVNNFFGDGPVVNDMAPTVTAKELYENRRYEIFSPDITDIDFNEKIYLKKEFRLHEIKNKPNYTTDFTYKKDFTLEPHQFFIRNYISPDTPYNGILIYGGTGVGKTCTVS
jgi:hypothetical protein